MLTDGFLARATTTLNERAELIREWVLSGKAQSMEDYRYSTGRLTGILEALEILSSSYSDFFENTMSSGRDKNGDDWPTS